ncbi:MAG TPA: hypothetical protein VGC54_02385 [Planctomycetota bacterium]
MHPPRARVVLLIAGGLLLAAAGDAVAVAAPAQEPAGPVQPAATLSRTQVQASAQRGVAWLLDQQLRDGTWDRSMGKGGGGLTAIAAYALLEAGVPAEHPALQRALAHLEPVRSRETGTTACQILTFAASRDARFLPVIEELVAELLSRQQHGAWNDSREEAGPSATQFAVLGLWAARQAGAEVPRGAFADAALALLARQDGTDQGEVGAARLAALEMCRQSLDGALPQGFAAAADRARGAFLDALAADWGIVRNPVHGGGAYVQWYALERAGSLLGVEEFGGHSWYPEVAAAIVDRQQGDGSWREDAAQADSCFALLTLSRATSRAAAPMQGIQPLVILATNDDVSPVQLRATGRAELIVWLHGFAPEVYFESAAGGLRVVRIEYTVDGQVVAVVQADPTQAWQGERLTGRYAFERQGVFQIGARVHLVDPDAPRSARDATQVIEARPITFAASEVLEPWQLAFAAGTWPDRMPREGLLAEASTLSEPAAAAFDGRQGTGWVFAADDAEPWLRAQFAQPVQADTLVISPLPARPGDRGRYDRLRRIAVRFAGADEWSEIALQDDPLQPTTWALPGARSVRGIEIRVLEHEAAAAGARGGGFAEIALQLRNDP